MIVKIRFKRQSSGKKNNLSFYQIIDIHENIIFDDLYSLQNEIIQGLEQTNQPGIYILN